MPEDSHVGWTCSTAEHCRIQQIVVFDGKYKLSLFYCKYNRM